MRQQEINAFVCAALECSVYVSPLDPGLTLDELMEIGNRVGLQAGEISDAMSRDTFEYFEGTRRLRPNERVTALAWQATLQPEEPEYRDFDALDFVWSQFNEVMRSEGGKAARLERRVIVERAIDSGIDRRAAEAEITILILTGQLVDKGGVLASKYGLVHNELPGAQRRKYSLRQPIRKPMRALAFPVVKDVIERRTDGRPMHAEPLEAFAEALTSLGYGKFRVWWAQTVSELRRAEVHTCATTICVLSAALVEGALTFVVKHARALGLDVFKSSDFDGDPRTWKIEDLVNSAARGGDSAILHHALHDRTRQLIRTRQRIHAGRMLSEYPGGPPDLRPEEAREARQTAEHAVRAVLDWLQKHPPGQ